MGTRSETVPIPYASEWAKGLAVIETSSQPRPITTISVLSFTIYEYIAQAFKY